MKAKYGILDNDIYNFDESEFMMGVISTGAVVTASERRGRPKTVQQGHREWATLVQGVGATGRVIPPFIIFAGKVLISSWYDNLPLEWVPEISPIRWINNKLALA